MKLTNSHYIRYLITIIILIFSFQSLTKADDIRDFQIEGMSIGDSLLKHVEKSKLKNFAYPYPNKEFKGILLKDISNNYDAIQFTVKDNDPKYIIHNISAKLYFQNKYNDCLNKMKIIVNAFDSVISDQVKTQKRDNIKRSKVSDPSGKSIMSYKAYHFEDKSAAQVYCTDWSDEISDRKGYIDELKSSLYSNEFTKYLQSLR